MKTTILSLADQIRTEADAYEYLESLRWPTGVTCPNCHGSDVYLIQPKNGISRKTRDGVMTQRRAWNCRDCRRAKRSPQFSAISGTVMHATKAPVRAWVLVLFDMIAAKNGISAREVERKYGVCPRTAWFMCHRIRECMRSDALLTTMRGTIVADETYIGGNPQRMNAKARARMEGRNLDPVPFTPGESRPNQHTAKTPVLSLVNTATGEVRSQVVPDVTGATLRKAISQQVDMTGSELWTDEGAWYNELGREFIAHNRVDHSKDEYVSRTSGASTNRAEGFFSQLKRSIDGTHHHVSREHLHRYVAEFDYRYSTCKVSDEARMAAVVGRADGRRLTYKRVRSHA